MLTYVVNFQSGSKLLARVRFFVLFDPDCTDHSNLDVVGVV